jgi:soluble lytic murein transglycosylase-like protein
VARLTAIAAAALLGLGAPAQAQIDCWAAEIGEASARFGIPEDWIRRVMKAESDGRTEFAGAPIVSRAGAIGLMQLMPGTWLEMRAANGLGADPFDPRDNIIAGTAYLRAMYDRFGYPGLFAAYNAGPRRYADHLVTGSSLPSETMNYLRKTAAGAASGRVPFSAVRSVSHRVITPIFAVQQARGRGLRCSQFAVRATGALNAQHLNRRLCLQRAPYVIRSLRNANRSRSSAGLEAA